MPKGRSSRYHSLKQNRVYFTASILTVQWLAHTLHEIVSFCESISFSSLSRSVIKPSSSLSLWQTSETKNLKGIKSRRVTITLHSCFITRPKANLFCSKLRNATVRRDSRTILSNQKSVFTQLTVTFICCKTDLNVGSKTRNLLFNTFCSNLAKQVARVSYSFYRSLNYYINTNEMPGELSRENLISSHVKITCYLHMWKYHRCYGYIINRAFHTKKLLKWNGLVFHWCLFHSFAALTREIFFNTRREISYLRAAM